MPDPPSNARLASLAPTLMPEICAYLERHRAKLASLLAAPGQDGMVLARARSKILDGLLTSLFQVAQTTFADEKGLSSVALAAVGSHGRGLVGLASDVDVRLSTTGPPDRVRALAEAFLYPLWDAGLSVGHQVITREEVLALAREDLPTATSLLDWRHLAGCSLASKALLDGAWEGVFSFSELPELMRKFEEEVESRRERFGGSVYLLEPDVKHGSGGLRDLDVALWAARARWKTTGIGDLVRVGALVPEEAEATQGAAELLFAIRNHLHARAGRRSDRLTFDMQELLARDLGYAGASTKDEALGPSVEAFMSDYYRHARTISRFCEQMLDRATPRKPGRTLPPVDLGGGLRSLDGQVALADPTSLTHDPALALRLYAKSVERREPVCPFARDAVARAAQDSSFCEQLRACPEAAEIFRDLACAIEETVHRSVLGSLHDVGLLTAMIPEFSPVVGRVHHDVYHVYTVDVHSLAAVERLRALFRDELRDAFPLASRVAGEIENRRVVLLSALLHDIGKAIGGKDHARRGAEMSREILERLGLPEDEIDDISHLVLQHLLMYHVATRRDLDDVRTIAEFAREVRHEKGLRELYLLTVADLSTTSPTSMTTWKAQMLEELFRATDTWMAGEVPRGDELRRELKRRLPEGDDAPFIDEFLRSMPERYLASNPPEAVAAHARVAKDGLGEPALMTLVPSRHAEAVELCVVGRDRPGFLAAVTAALTASRLAVHKAEIHSRPLPDGAVQAVDLLWVRHLEGGAEGVAEVLPKIQSDLRALMTGQVRAADLLASNGWSRWRERPSPPVKTEVSIDDRSSSRYTVLDVLTRDRPGLLFTLATTLHELDLSIALAKIDTEGTRATDVFYVTEADGSKVAEGPRAARVRDRLLAALERLATEGTGR